MKKNDFNPANDTSKNETKNKPGKKANNKTPNSANEDMGAMKIGKAHSIADDDRVSVNLKEKHKK